MHTFIFIPNEHACGDAGKETLPERTRALCVTEFQPKDGYHMDPAGPESRGGADHWHLRVSMG